MTPLVRQTSGQLADGREIIWFDSPGQPDRTAADRRELPAAEVIPELRFDRLRNQWVSVAARRSGRTFLPSVAECPLCPTRGDVDSEIPGSDYQVVVFENRFPSFAGPPAQPGSDEFFEQRPAAGRCEVVCFTSEHDLRFAQLTPQRARLVIEAWAERTRALSMLPEIEQVFVFENFGEAIGVTLNHPHGQIYGYPFVSPVAADQFASAHAYRARTGRNLYADVVAHELREGTRVVFDSAHWIGFVPFAARWPVEVHLYPRRPVADFTELDADQREELATVYLDLLKRTETLYDRPLPYISAWHQAGVRTARDLNPFHLEWFSIQRAADKIKYLAGSESAMGAFINDRTPEDVAAQLRSAGVA